MAAVFVRRLTVFVMEEGMRHFFTKARSANATSALYRTHIASSKRSASLFDMPRIERVGDSVKAAAAIATAVAEGELTPMEAAELSKVVHGYTHAVEFVPFLTKFAHWASCSDARLLRTGP